MSRVAAATVTEGYGYIHHLSNLNVRLISLARRGLPWVTSTVRVATADRRLTQLTQLDLEV
jgi:hypothetical protein